MTKFRHLKNNGNLIMASFKFRLEQVLEYRRSLEDEAKQALAEAIQQKDAIIRRMEEVHFEQEKGRKVLSHAGSLSAAERWLHQNYLDALKEELNLLQERLMQVEEEVDRCRTELVVKSQERSLLDKLKEKQAARHAELERQKEQRDFDETATLRFKPASF